MIVCLSRCVSCNIDGEFNNQACSNLSGGVCSYYQKRSVGVVTKDGYIIFLINDIRVGNGVFSLDSKADNFFKRITSNYNLGSPTQGIFFDQGSSPGMMWEGNVLVENTNNIGSVILIYKD